MTKSRVGVDRQFLIIVSILTVVGFIIFYSASLGVLAKSDALFSSVIFSQSTLGLLLGFIAMVLVMRLDYKIWRKWAFALLVLGVLSTLLVFTKLGLAHGGARRWIIIAGQSFQPSELLKLAFVIYFSAWAARAKGKIKNFKEGFLPLCGLLVIIGALLLKQPDTDTYAMIVFAGLAIYIAAGGRWKFVFISIVVGVLALGALAFERPYLMQRLNTFWNPQSDALGASYQAQQSLIAIGSGGFFGRGFGQSVQKFNYLPEPMGDSIFAVLSEEWGFLGAIVIIGLFVFFAIRGLKLASLTPDTFGRLLIVGLVIMIIAQAFVNIGAMLGVLPLSGITLPFVSHGGTSLFFTLLEAGIILSVSRSVSAVNKN